MSASATVTVASPSVSGSYSPVYQYRIAQLDQVTSGFDPVGNITAYYDSTSGQWSNIQYDALNRLVRADGPSSFNGGYQYFCWTYDNFGNRLLQASEPTGAFTSTKTIGSQTCTPYSGVTASAGGQNYNANNQLTSATLISTSFGYDVNGNMINDGSGGHRYAYDVEGRLCAEATTVGSSTTYTGYLYDAEGNRVAKGTIGAPAVDEYGNLAVASCDITLNNFSVTSQYLVGPDGKTMTELNGSGAWQHTDVSANGELIATYNPGGLHFQFSDWLGTRRVQTDYAGSSLVSKQNLPFGEPVGAAPSAATEKQFTGQERDAESGHDYFGARYYANVMGRWTGPDWSSNPSPIPFGNIYRPQSLNLYSYVGNNPMTGTDPYGHLDCSGGATQDVACAVTAAAKAFFAFLKSGSSNSGSLLTSVSSQQSYTLLQDDSNSLLNRLSNFNRNFAPNFSGLGVSSGGLFSLPLRRGVAASAGYDFLAYNSGNGETTRFANAYSNGYTGMQWTQPGGVEHQTHDDDVNGWGTGAEAHASFGRTTRFGGTSTSSQSSLNLGVVYGSWTHSEGWENYQFTVGLGSHGFGFTTMQMTTNTKEMQPD